jgi:hypothetical protein
LIQSNISMYSSNKISKQGIAEVKKKDIRKNQIGNTTTV